MEEHFLKSNWEQICTALLVIPPEFRVRPVTFSLKWQRLMPQRNIVHFALDGVEYEGLVVRREAIHNHEATTETLNCKRISCYFLTLRKLQKWLLEGQLSEITGLVP